MKSDNAKSSAIIKDIDHSIQRIPQHIELSVKLNTDCLKSSLGRIPASSSPLSIHVACYSAGQPESFPSVCDIQLWKLRTQDEVEAGRDTATCQTSALELATDLSLSLAEGYRIKQPGNWTSRLPGAPSLPVPVWMDT